MNGRPTTLLDRTVQRCLHHGFVHNLSGACHGTYTITAYNQAFPTVPVPRHHLHVTISLSRSVISEYEGRALSSDENVYNRSAGNISPVVAHTFTWTATYDGNPIPSDPA